MPLGRISRVYSRSADSPSSVPTWAWVGLVHDSRGSLSPRPVARIIAGQYGRFHAMRKQDASAASKVYVRIATIAGECPVNQKGHYAV